jgi:ATP-dependent Clp protease, protease subunit
MDNYFNLHVNGTTAEIDIFGEISQHGTANVRDIVGELRDLPKDVSMIDLRINSGGGSIMEGWAIFNALARQTATIRATIEGVAASMASVIAMVADEIVMNQNAMLMIHKPFTMVVGNSGELRKEADLLDKLQANLVKAYQRHSSLSTEDLDQMMEAETWMDANEALNFGFAEVIADESQAARADISSYGYINAPEEALSILSIKGSVMTEKREEVTYDFLISNHADLVKQIRAEEVGRIKAVSEQSMVGYEDVIQSMLYDGVSTGADAAVAVLHAVKATQAKQLETHRAEAITPVVAAEPVEVPENLSNEEKWKRDSSLREEFADYEAFEAFNRHYADGDIHILRGK